MQPQPPKESTGLLALMLLHDARREARYDAEGNPVLLEEQNRTLWDNAKIREGLSLVEQAMDGTLGAFAIQAGIAAVHCRAARAEETDWREILRLYDLLDTVQPSPVVSLNRAVAVAMTQGPQPALAILENLATTEGELDNYHLLHAARADLFRRSGFLERAAASYVRAIALAKNDRERSWLERRLHELESGPSRTADGQPLEVVPKAKLIVFQPLHRRTRKR